MEKIKEYKWVWISVLVLFVGSFYWTQIRPVQIKKSCSWVEAMEGGKPEVPAFLGITKEEAERRTIENRLNGKDKCGSFDEGSKLKEICEATLVVSEQPPRPAQPAVPEQKITRQATKSEYGLCLRRNGL